VPSSLSLVVVDFVLVAAVVSKEIEERDLD